MVDKAHTDNPDTAVRAGAPRFTEPRMSPVVWGWIVVFVVAAPIAFSIDLPAAGWFHAGNVPKAFREIFALSEVFGHGLGVVLIVATVWALDARRRWAVPRLLAGAWCAGLAADVIKALVGRIRPRDLLAPGQPIVHSVWNTFTGWLPVVHADVHGHSFPSAHTATAFGLAVSLASIYPRGAWWFYVLACLVACQRLDCSAHYPSDVLAGAAVGLLIGVIHRNATLQSRWWQDIEHRLGRREP
ncbi:MAG: phosphatase PAP2 family protein [Planctomycetota bacterium]|nr:MAG: phosphatase PAP2 family protein [Planctomycetota bacterium]